ncbi:lactoylglutathione lyase [Candidatus Aerophobetes bacterium]|uniref:Aldoketomutase n=1 Tax=Aerophobetes bacterium TaxID=2030807 RepID=A0A2A4YM39_UNCAE|nr:MAG: lactoylglutathione lyase [Candidatus Aerophobetes bacterium]
MRLLHTMIRVENLERSIEFYTKVLKMRILRRKDNEGGKYTLVFLGYDDESKSHAIELTHNWDNRKYEHGTYFGHIAIGVSGIYKLCEEIESMGGAISRKPGPLSGSTSVIAFVKDPDGYSIELIEQENRSN